MKRSLDIKFYNFIFRQCLPASSSMMSERLTERTKNQGLQVRSLQPTANKDKLICKIKYRFSKISILIGDKLLREVKIPVIICKLSMTEKS